MSGHFRVRLQFGSVPGRQFRYFLTAGSTQIVGHVPVERENGGSRPHFSAHVADGRLSGSRQRSGTFAEIFDDGVGRPLHGKQPGQFQDDILRSRPTVQFTGQFHTDEFRHLELPFHPGHHIHRIGTAYTDGYHAQSSGIGRMRIRPHHHSARESIILEYDLVDDAGSRFPETDAVFRSHALQESIHLAVGFQSDRQVGTGPLIGLNQMVTMHGRRNRHRIFPRIHELQQRHLRRRVLHGYPVRSEIHIIRSPAEIRQ